jgi:hypothetical protein
MKLHMGDVIARRNKAGKIVALYVVQGWTARGKLILERESGTEFTTWWSSVRDLPERWELVP